VFDRVVHDVRNRNALSTTSSELADMPMPAISGVTIPAKASGNTTRL
jgi:hypothetical protein